MHPVARRSRMRPAARRAAVAIALAGTMLALAPDAQARDFLSSFFGSLMGGGRAPAPPIQLPFAGPGDSAQPAPQRTGRGGGTAYCVRACDGRYFPLAASGGQSRAEMCKSFCPASETRVVYGSSIDNAATESGKPYSELPNAFRYREELVAGCTCNGKDPGGLARVGIEDDPTIRKGDLVAGADGIAVATSSSNGRHGANYSPASKSVRARFERLPVVAAE